jgi:hypothetical protein
MTAAFKGGLVFNRATGGSPAYEAIGEVKSLSGLGQTNPLVDATSHDSTAMEYIAGLPDGQEITIECNYLASGSPENSQDRLVSDVETGANHGYQIVLTKATVSPNIVKTFTFTGTPLSWVINPSYSDANTISFTVKISGSITRT